MVHIKQRKLEEKRFADYESLQDYMETYQPGITEEIQGFADTLNVSPKKVVYWLYCYVQSEGNRSQICARALQLRSKPKDK